jgi:AraC-like DNA-binding protein
MRLEVIPPLPALEDDVLYGWVLEGPARRHGASADERLLPCAWADMIINLGDPIHCSTTPGSWFLRPDAWHEGMFPSYFMLRPTGRVQIVGVRFRTGRSRRFVPGPQSEFTGTFIPLADVYGRAGVDLEEIVRIAARRSARDAVAHLQSFLAGVRAREDASIDETAVWAARRLQLTHGRLPIARLAQEAGLSARTIERRFLDEIGVTPKRFARILRLKRAYKLLPSTPRGGLATVAHECGYYDQAHMDDDFRELAGLTPSEYVRRRDGIHEAFFATEPVARATPLTWNGHAAPGEGAKPRLDAIAQRERRRNRS